jgi:hypothetical protein
VARRQPATGRGQDAPERPQEGRTGPQGVGALSTGTLGVPGAARRKYGNKPIEINGIHFDSQKEGKRYGELRFMERNGVIRALEVHPRFPLVVHGEDCGVYVADFAWIDPETGERVIEDVKSAATRKLPTYRLKVKMVWALYGLRVREV